METSLSKQRRSTQVALPRVLEARGLLLGAAGGLGTHLTGPHSSSRDHAIIIKKYKLPSQHHPSFPVATVLTDFQAPPRARHSAPSAPTETPEEAATEAQRGLMTLC